MGEIVAAAIVAHQPTVMLDEVRRVALGGGADTTLVEPGFRLIREHLAERGVDTLVIIDTHWFTTFEHVFAGADHFAGKYTSEEVPRVICDLPYDYPGAPDLARALHAVAKEQGIPTTNAVTPTLPLHYPTINLVHHLRTHEAILSIGVLQTADAGDYLAFGAAIAEATRRTDARVALLGSGGMSHRFHPAAVIARHVGYDPASVIDPDARDFDQRILQLWESGDHRAVINLYDDYRSHAPEGRFGHYLILAGAFGGPAFAAPGAKYSNYENSVGTGQVHVVFDLTKENVS